MLFQRIKQLLSGPALSYICILLACLGRVGHMLFNSVLMTDRSYQLQAAKNFFQKNGISILEADVTDLSRYEYLPLIKWPPAYSILAAPFTGFGETGFVTAAIAIDILAAILFVFAARKIFQLLSPERWLVNLYTLVIGFHFYHFGMGWSTDLLSLAFLLWGTFFTIRIIKTGKNNLGLMIGAIFFLLLSGFTRYLSVPLAFVPPFCLILYGRFNQAKYLVKAGISILTRLLILFGLQFLIQKNLSTGSLLYPFDKGFFPENLLETGPFLFEAMGNLAPAASFIERNTGVSLTTIQELIISVHLGLAVLLLAGTAAWMIRRKFRFRDPGEVCIMLSFFFCLATLAVLAYLSLSFKASANERAWTYISELRYYAAAIFFVQLSLFVYAFKNHGRKAIRYLFAGILALMIASAIHGAFFITRSIAKERWQFTERPEYLEMKTGLQQLEDLSKMTTEPVICVSNEPMFTNLATIHFGIPGLHSIPDSTRSFSAGKPVIVFIAIKKSFGRGMMKNISLDTSSLISETPHWAYYLQMIDNRR